MRTFIAAAALLIAAGAPPAAADPHPRGLACQVETQSSPQGSYDVQLSGGPVTVAEAVGPDGRLGTVTLRCSLQYGSRHADPDVATASATGDGAAVLLPTQAWYAGDDSAQSVCTEVTFAPPGGDSTTLYWDPFDHRWTTDAGASCETPVACPAGSRSHHSCWSPLDPAGIADDVFVEVVDPAVCPAFQVLFPPEGDVAGLWDCPPYDS